MFYRQFMRLNLTILLCFLSLFCHAQYFEAELKEALRSEARFVAYLDSRGAFISRNGVRVVGIKVGAQFDEKLTFGIGYNQLYSDYDNTIVHEGIEQNVELRYWYLSPFVEYTFYRDRKWELMIPVQFGFGESYYHTAIDSRNIRYSFVMSYEPAIAFQYRFLGVFGAGLGLGYRLMVVPNPKLEESFTSPVYMLKFKVYFGDLIEKLKQP